jgi:hypothetical protein
VLIGSKPFKRSLYIPGDGGNAGVALQTKGEQICALRRTAIRDGLDMVNLRGAGCAALSDAPLA